MSSVLWLHFRYTFIANQTIAAAVAVALLILITGAHHFDGLLDFGDGSDGTRGAGKTHQGTH